MTQAIPIGIRAALYGAGLSLLLPTTAAYAGIITSPTGSAADLVNALIGTGVTVLSSSYVGSATQSGLFSGGISAGLGFDSGILLTTGNANDAVGPNSSPNTTGFTGSGGTTDLPVGTAQTFDTASLTFTFQFDDGSVGGDVYFNYIFASEEYTEYVGDQYNDRFALLIDGVNVAIAPNGSTVAINSVNCKGTAPNCSSYNDNPSRDPVYDIEYDGFTDALTAKRLRLSPGQHTAQFVIADVSDDEYDSAVFIQALSFSINQRPPSAVSEPGPLALVGAGLFGLGAMGRRRRRS